MSKCGAPYYAWTHYNIAKCTLLPHGPRTSCHCMHPVLCAYAIATRVCALHSPFELTRLSPYCLLQYSFVHELGTKMRSRRRRRIFLFFLGGLLGPPSSWLSHVFCGVNIIIIPFVQKLVNNNIKTSSRKPLPFDPSYMEFTFWE
jgi:hypothetical protein